MLLPLVASAGLFSCDEQTFALGNIGWVADETDTGRRSISAWLSSSTCQDLEDDRGSIAHHCLSMTGGVLGNACLSNQQVRQNLIRVPAAFFPTARHLVMHDIQSCRISSPAFLTCLTRTHAFTLYAISTCQVWAATAQGRL